MATSPMDMERAHRAAQPGPDGDGAKNAEIAAPLDDTGAGPAEELPRVLGRYLLLRRIARGGMGEVYLASTMGIEGAERPVVVKLIRRDHAKDPSFIARFLDEARVQAQLQHSGVAQVIEAALDEATGEPYAVVEHVEGKSLGDVRARALSLGVRIGWAEAVAVATMIAEALAHVHERKDAGGRALAIVHRDLSPQNVMVSYAGDVKIIDFGTARGMNRRCRTVSGVVFAKPGYVAPEVANGDTGDARVDVYALGVMLWELCAGRRFLQGDAAVHMAAVARNAHDLPPIAAQVGAPPELDAILAKLTAFDRETRYGMSRVAARDLAKLLASAPPLPGGERGVRARTAYLMASLFTSEPAKSRREFARLVTAARARCAGEAEAARAVAHDSAPPAAPEEEGLLPGTRLRLVREIGAGATSVVHEAEHVDLGRRVAVKILAPDHGASPEFAARFRREARAMSRLSHDGLVELYDFGRATDGRLFCVMELLEGETVEALVAREREVDWQLALRIAAKVLGALEVAHEAGIVHRDIKPANLFLTRAGTVKILDFGLANTPEDVGEAHLGAPGEEGGKLAGFTLFGTPEYMSPEQAAGGRVDGRTDLYALGCVLYEMVTGGLPFTGASAAAIVDAKMKGSPERPRDRVPAKRLPDPVDDLLMRALSRHPGLRFQSAAEMREAVLLALQAPARARKRRRAMGFAALAGVMAFASVLLVGKASDLGVRMPFSQPARPAVAQAAQPEIPPAPPAVAAPNEASAAPAPVQLAEAPIAAPTEAAEAAPAAPSRARAPQKKASDARSAGATKLAQNEPSKTPSPTTPASAPAASEPSTAPASLAAASPAPAAANDAVPAPSSTAQADAPAAPVRAAPLVEPKDKNKDEAALHLRRKKKTRMAKANGGSSTTGSKPATKTK
ncbi:serine/threonine-protein kinase [Polyangium aurulentum]|uniref:serine/threonine-protein kinase n=1 Tax=Polyangium aurulentum TaxID=2567896 RepID=UPI0010AE8B32|nr:serine/threonine-protein kinase [Polyangium aurulentum]UQA55134.1 serine/threonine protein kinase [Polyangium aurulentum]